jgi:UDP-N-acetylglucosamine 2-epimerase (non-hydrolysing)
MSIYNVKRQNGDKVKVLTVFGTRPEAVKMCPLARLLAADPRFEPKVLVTAQHRELLDSVLDIFSVTPDYDLNLMRTGQTLAQITSGVTEGVFDILGEYTPDIVLVHGDTTTSFAAALAAFYRKITVGHVEAGLRTWDRYSPFPEEINRTLTGRLATLHFAPTEDSRANLAREGITENVYVTGNTVLDAFKYTVSDGYKFKSEALRNLPAPESGEKLVVMTAHRRENLDGGIASICRAVKRLADAHPELRFVYPMHPNPAVRSAVLPVLSDVGNVTLCEPVDVTDMHNLLARAWLCLTDSGGLQEEAPSFGLPVLLMRSETERPEAVRAGTVEVVGTGEFNIVAAVERLLYNPACYEFMSNAKNPYGDGKASERIADIIYSYFTEDSDI